MDLSESYEYSYQDGTTAQNNDDINNALSGECDVSNMDADYSGYVSFEDQAQYSAESSATYTGGYGNEAQTMTEAESKTSDCIYLKTDQGAGDDEEEWVDEGDGSWYCEVCDCHMSGKLTFDAHLAGARHQKNMKNQALGVPIKKTKANVTIGIHKAKVVDQEPHAQTMLDMCVSPLIGLQYITEYASQNADVEPTYMCKLCDAKCDMRMLISHVIGLKHRESYMKDHHLNYFVMIRQRARKADQTAAAEEFAKEIEAMEGRHKITVRVETTFVPKTLKAATADASIAAAMRRKREYLREERAKRTRVGSGGYFQGSEPDYWNRDSMGYGSQASSYGNLGWDTMDETFGMGAGRRGDTRADMGRSGFGGSRANFSGPGPRMRGARGGVTPSGFGASGSMPKPLTMTQLRAESAIRAKLMGVTRGRGASRAASGMHGAQHGGSAGLLGMSVRDSLLGMPGRSGRSGMGGRSARGGIAGMERGNTRLPGTNILGQRHQGRGAAVARGGIQPLMSFSSYADYSENCAETDFTDDSYLNNYEGTDGLADEQYGYYGQQNEADKQYGYYGQQNEADKQYGYYGQQNEGVPDADSYDPMGALVSNISNVANTTEEVNMLSAVIANAVLQFKRGQQQRARSARY